MLILISMLFIESIFNIIIPIPRIFIEIPLTELIGVTIGSMLALTFCNRVNK